MDASLVMRDRETDSWWSIMTSDAIGGALDGSELVELPIGEKAQWKDWVKRYPKSKVLSVEGVEHDERNPYADYFESDRTFRNASLKDERLRAKEPIFGFWLDGKAHAAPYSAFAGGKVFELPGLGERRLVLHRDRGAAIFASTRGFLINRDEIPESGLSEWLVDELAAGRIDGAEAVSGIDTFWYNWSAVNEGTVLVE